MTIQPSGVAPYAPPSAVLNIIDRYRNHGLSAPFTLEVLQRAGVSESLAPRTLQALKLLDLVGEDGFPSGEFTDLSKARSDEYEDRLAAIIRKAYADVFSFADPESDPIERIEDAFRGYTPRSQRGRMVTLFLNLCRAAGMQVAVPSKTETAGPRPASRPARGTPSTRVSKPASSASRGAPSVQPSTFTEITAPALVGLVAQLPKPGSSWTTKQRANFLKAMEATLDMLIDVDDTVHVSPADREEEEDDL